MRRGISTLISCGIRIRLGDVGGRLGNEGPTPTWFPPCRGRCIARRHGGQVFGDMVDRLNNHFNRAFSIEMDSSFKLMVATR
jgi:hypothetical protein